MPNTALNRTTQVLLTNKSGGSVAYGAVVIVDTTTDSSFTTTTTSGISTAEVGVVLEPNGIANNALGMVAVGGWAPKATLNTAATRGQFIKSHTVAGQGTPHSSPQQEGDFAVALEASANPAVCLFGSPNGPTSGTGTVTTTGSPASGQMAKFSGATSITTAVSGTDYVAPIAVHGGVINGRLTTETGVPVSTANRSAQGTIYFTPYNGNQIALYTSSVWVVLTFAEISLALSGLTSGKNYDVFVDYNAGTPQLVLSAAWTNDTTRADALALQDGVYVKSGTTTYRLVGTIRTTGTTTTEDSLTKRTDGTANWSYTTGSYRQANGTTANQVEVIVGLLEDAIDVKVVGTIFANSAGLYPDLGLGVNSTTASSAVTDAGTTTSTTPGLVVNRHVSYVGYPRLGYSYFAWLEFGVTNATFYGTDSSIHAISGITGSSWN